MTSQEARRRFAAARVARLATVDGYGAPHLVALVFAVDGDVIYSAVDFKPKRTKALARLANVRVNPGVCLLVDVYDDRDWTKLWWARADGVARVLPPSDPQARHGVELLAARYDQYRRARPDGDVIAIEVTRWSGWLADG